MDGRVNEGGGERLHGLGVRVLRAIDRSGHLDGR